MSRSGIGAVVVGASAGAVQALSRLLPPLAATYRLPILVVVHIPASGSRLVSLFGPKCRMSVREPDDKEPILAGTIYFAPGGYHMQVEEDRSISLSLDDPVVFARPSLDVLFESAAHAFGPSLVGIVLTGGNEDGARGLRAIGEAGGVAVVEDPAHADTSIMPAAALAACPGARVLSLDQIAAYLEEVGRT